MLDRLCNRQARSKNCEPMDKNRKSGAPHQDDWGLLIEILARENLLSLVPGVWPGWCSPGGLAYGV